MAVSVTVFLAMPLFVPSMSSVAFPAGGETDVAALKRQQKNHGGYS